MFKKNKISQTDDNTKLWRYMTYPRFVDLLKTSELYFARIDCFEDNLEATQPQGNSIFARETENPWQVFEKMCTDENLKIFRNMVFANCWHMNESENPDMWGNYVIRQGDEGIAIQTSFKNISESFITTETLTDIKMKYIDYETEYVNYFLSNIRDFLSIKDKKFQYENELRIITVEDEYPEFDPDSMEFGEKFEYYTTNHKRIKVCLEKLIQGIYLCPNSSSEFKKRVENDLVANNLSPALIHVN